MKNISKKRFKKFWNGHKKRGGGGAVINTCNLLPKIKRNNLIPEGNGYSTYPLYGPIGFKLPFQPALWGLITLQASKHKNYLVQIFRIQTIAYNNPSWKENAIFWNKHKINKRKLAVNTRHKLSFNSTQKPQCSRTCHFDLQNINVRI